ncbi:MAG: hypothetical protein K8L99_05535 [Anaerolineae bacterium]|nr:hypothetical protein [Anaerolineae bacterium]
MQPGLSRAIPLGIVGFLIGTALLILIRALQSLDPWFDAQLALIMGTFFCAGFFIWGMGAFDPKMNVHAHEPEEGEEHAVVVAEEEAEEEPAKPFQILSSYGWTITTILLLLILALAGFAYLPTGLTLQTVSQPEGNMAAVGFYETQLFGQTIVFSELVSLLIFVGVMLLSMVAIAGVIGITFFGLSRGVTEVATTNNTQLPPPPLAREQPSTISRLLFWVMFVVLFLVLFALLYFVLIGIVIGPGPLNLVLSLSQALPLAFIILRPRGTARVVGQAAGWLARQLRRLPNGLQ